MNNIYVGTINTTGAYNQGVRWVGFDITMDIVLNTIVNLNLRY